KFIILGVANIWDEKKGFNYFLEMNKYLKNDETIVLVGLSNKQKKELPKNIIGISRTDSVKELAEIYSAADIFVNPTLEDNFPTTNLEALACGIPVITFDTGGSPEAIDGETGRVVEQGNTEAIYREVSNIRNNRKNMSKNCTNRAEEMYKGKNCYLEYLKLYMDTYFERSSV